MPEKVWVGQPPEKPNFANLEVVTGYFFPLKRKSRGRGNFSQKSFFSDQGFFQGGWTLQPLVVNKSFNLGTTNG